MTYQVDQSGQNIVPIPDLLERRDAIRQAAQGLPDDVFNEVSSGAWKIEMAILEQPSVSEVDLRIKLSLWDELISDPMCITEDHLACWEQLKADMASVMRLRD